MCSSSKRKHLDLGLAMTQVAAAASKLDRKKIFKSRGGSASFSLRKNFSKSSKENSASVELPSFPTCVMRTAKAELAGEDVVDEDEAG